MVEWSPHAAVHGGPDALGVARHDFSTNSNAAGPCPVALAAFRRADPSRYPDPSYAALRTALARFHRVEPARIVLAASASEFIFRLSSLVARAAPGGQVWLPEHCYGDYWRAAAVWGLPPAAIPSSARLLWACDPASPLGTPHEQLGTLVDGLAPQQICVLDLAYEPLRLHGSLALSARQRDRVWRLWTPNKALGCTGARAAYAIAPASGQDIALQLEQLAPSWILGTQGVALLHAWTTPAVQSWLLASLDTLRAWKARQLEVCALLGWKVRLGSVASFFCAQPPAHHLPEALQALRKHGIKLRDATSFGLPGQVRLAVLPPASQDALATAWTAPRKVTA